MPRTGGELGGFLSLVMDRLEKIPAINSALAAGTDSNAASIKDEVQVQTEPPPAIRLEPVALHTASRNKNSASDQSKYLKNQKKEEPVALPMAVRALREPATVSVTPSVALDVPIAVPALVNEDSQHPSGENGDYASAVRHVSLAAALTPARGNVAFALVLSPNNLETKTVPEAGPSPVVPTVPLVPQHSNSGPALARAIPIPSSDPNSAASPILPRLVANETSVSAPPSFQELPLNPAQSRVDASPKPTQPIQKDESGPSRAVAPGVVADHRTGPTPRTLSPSSQASLPDYTETGSVWSSTQSHQQSRDSTPSLPFAPEALASFSRLIEGQGAKSEAGGVAAADLLDTVPNRAGAVVKTNDTPPVVSRNAPRSTPAAESGISELNVLGSKPEPFAKRESPEFRFTDKHAEERGTSVPLAVLAEPVESAGILDTRMGSSAVPEPSALKVASEPEIKTGIAPPSTRQISLKLSTDDSTRVNIDLTERAGKVLVAVRTPDHELAQSLQTDLGDLVGRLENKGFKTETWVPAVAHQSAPPVQSSGLNKGFDQPQHSGPGHEDARKRPGQNGSNQRQRARWTARLEQTMSTNEPRSESE